MSRRQRLFGRLASRRAARRRRGRHAPPGRPPAFGQENTSASEIASDERGHRDEALDAAPAEAVLDSDDEERGIDGVVFRQAAS
jgi:hypothetical protein